MMANNAMKKFVQRFLAIAVVLVSLCGVSSAEQAGNNVAPSKDWYVAIRLGFQPYTMEASGTVGNREFDAKADLSDILDNTDTTIAGGEVEFGMGRLFLILNGFYQKSEAEKGDSTLGARMTFTETGFNPLVGYRIYQGDGQTPVSVDVMAGAYYVKMDADVEIYGPLGNIIARDNDISFTDVMIGARAYYGFTKKFGAGVFGEIGGGGSELQYVVAANLVYNFTNWFALSGGYKYWYFKYEDESKLLNTFEQKTYGPVIGMQFKF
jgi:hypothetical protein